MAEIKKSKKLKRMASKQTGLDRINAFTILTAHLMLPL